MCLNVLQLYDDEVINIYNKVKEKYSKQYPDRIDRFYHIKGVCKMATQLANKYKCDVKSCQIASLLHDYYKYESYEEMSRILSKEEIKECEDCKVLYHAYASSKVPKLLFNINNFDIESAIKYHVFGHTHMTRLEEIILISDYTEETRKYQSCCDVRDILLNKGIEEAVYESTLRVIKLLKSENKEPHPMQYEVLKEYERKIKMKKIEVVKNALSRVNACDIKVYDTNEKSPFFSHVVIASVDSVRQLNAVLEYLKDGFNEASLPIKGVSGANTEWVILDGCDILVHVFNKEERERFALDKMYMDCEVVE